MFHNDRAKETPRDGRARFLTKSLVLESHSEVSLLQTSEGKKRTREVERMVRKKEKPNSQLDIALPVSSYDLTVSTPSTAVTEDKRGSELGLFPCSSSSSTESLPFLIAIPFLQLTTKQLSKI